MNTRIDWSKGPKGAIGFSAKRGVLDAGITSIWYRRTASGDLEYCMDGSSHWMASYRVPDDVVWLEEQRAAWGGAGLPPVGTVCEFMKHNSPPAPEGKWTTGTIRYLSDYTVIIGGDRCEHVHHPRNVSFRTIRTPEQIEAEARRNAIDDLADELGGHPDAVSKRDREMAAYLYDQGYRKQVAP